MTGFGGPNRLSFEQVPCERDDGQSLFNDRFARIGVTGPGRYVKIHIATRSRRNGESVNGLNEVQSKRAGVGGSAGGRRQPFAPSPIVQAHNGLNEVQSKRAGVGGSAGGRRQPFAPSPIVQAHSEKDQQ